MKTEVGVIGLAGLVALLLLLSGISCLSWRSVCFDIPSFLQTDQALAENDQTKLAVGIGLVIIGAATLTPICINYLVPASTQKGAEAMRFLYMSHFLSAFGDRMWQIALPMVFMDIFKDTLLPTGVYTIVVYLFVVYLLPFVGTWIDLSPRLYVLQTSVIVENCCIIGTALILCLTTALDEKEGIENANLLDGTVLGWFAALVVLGCLGELMNNASTLSIEKDWVVVISEGSDIPISRINAVMRRIDLSCKALSPAVFAFLYELFGQSIRKRIFYGCALVGVWNMLSFPLEVMLNRLVFLSFPKLKSKLHSHNDGTIHAHPHGHSSHYHVRDATSLDETTLVFPDDVKKATGGRVLLGYNTVQNDETHVHDDGTVHSHPAGDEAHYHVISTDPNCTPTILETSMRQPSQLLDNHYPVLVGYHPQNLRNASILKTFCTGLGEYRREPIFLASVAYTMLYASVLDSGNLFVSYLDWAGLEPWIFGMGRGLGAVCGLVGTFLYTFLDARIGVRKTGLVTLWGFFLLICPALLPSPVVMVFAVALSRVFLWSFDLVVTELSQKHVEEENRAQFSSVQTASYQLCYIFIQCAGIWLNDPHYFEILKIISVSIVGLATLIYTYWYFSFVGDKKYSKVETNNEV